MRKMLVLGYVGILSMAAGTVTSDAQLQGRGTGRDTYIQGDLEYRIVQIRRHAGRFGHTVFATEAETVPYLFIGEPRSGPAAPGILTSIAVVGMGAGGAEQTTAGHPVGPASHTQTRVGVRTEQGEPLTSQPAAAGADESDQTGGATAQPDPGASPVWQRPPGALGPGRPVLGWSGPGLPGPGRAAFPGS
jgi:hypothetical protein